MCVRMALFDWLFTRLNNWLWFFWLFWWPGFPFLVNGMLNADRPG